MHAILTLQYRNTVNMKGFQRLERPSSVKLAGVKHELYHPRLPTLRRMDMDDACHRLSTEHSRTTTPCSRDEFASLKSTLLTSREPIHCKVVVSRKTRGDLRTYQPHGSSSHTESWSAILRSLASRTTGSTDQQSQAHHGHGEAPQLQVTGLAMRTRHPAITSAWQQYTHHGNSRPSSASGLMPAAMYSRYRSPGLRLHTVSPWK